MSFISKIIAGTAALMLIVLLAFGTVSCGTISTEDTTMLTNYTASADNVTSISLDIDAAEIKITEGDAFYVEAINVPEDSFSAKVTNGTWTIREKNSGTKKVSLNLFGWKIPLSSNSDNTNGKDTPQILLTIPKNFRFDNLQINVGAGALYAGVLEGDDVTINIGAGKCEIDRLVAHAFADTTVGAGELLVHDTDSYNLNADCGVGSIKIYGNILGYSKVKCGVGGVNLYLTADESEYSYNVDCGLGEVRIGSKHQISSSHTSVGNTSAQNSFHLDCGIGSIELDFNY